MHFEERDTQFNINLLRKLRSINDGELPRLFKQEEPKRYKKSESLFIPRKQIDIFEEIKGKRRQLASRSKVELFEEPQSPGCKKFAKNDFDRIMCNRENLKRARYGNKKDNYSDDAQKSVAPSASAAQKLNERKLRAWVNECYDAIHNSQTVQLSKDLKQLAHGDTEGNEANIVYPPDVLETESLVSLEADLSDQDGKSSSLLSETVLREKAKSRDTNDIMTSNTAETGTRWDTTGKKLPEKHLMAHEGINHVLEDFYIEDLKELKSLAFDEELYAYDNVTNEIIGSWRVNAKVCEDREDCISVQFEGLIGEHSHHNWVMYANGIMDRTFTPLTEFRVEQMINKSGESTSNTMFFHKKQRKWLFDVRESAGKSETRKTFQADHQQMQRVLAETGNLLLVRKAIMYRYPLNFEENDDEYQQMPCNIFCGCTEVAGGCSCKNTVPWKIRKKFRLKMRAITIGGHVVRCNYRFYTPVKVKFHEVELQVVRVRRRVEMPGKLIQTSNYFITTAGQLMAVTFNDPYPYSTHYYLQIDPKSVLDPKRVIPPERIVPLRERYMCDPELRQYYESEVQRFTNINQKYFEGNISVFNGLKAVFQDLLNDKPHRVNAYIREFFFEGYRFAHKECQGRNLRRGKKKSWDKDDPLGPTMTP